MIKQPLTIRPHHLLCMQGYQGKGYDKDFVANMDKIVNLLRSEPATKVRLLADCDDICSACPHRQKIDDIHKCIAKDESDNQLKISMEKTLLGFLGLSEGGVYEISYLFDTVNSKIKTKPCARKMYCDKCMWHDVCLWYLSRE